MFCLKDGRCCKMPLGAICVFLFHHFIFFFHLAQFCGGVSQVVGPSEPVVAIVGDDTVLPCHLDPAVNAADMTVEWTRSDLTPKFVHVWRDGVELVNKKNEAYMERTSLPINNLKLGDISLKLSKVKLSDRGSYKCFSPALSGQASVELVVGVVSSLTITVMRNSEDSGKVVLQCESAGWYPEPELLWLDGEGNLLSAGPTETLRGPDDLYTVSSRVTVEKRHSNNITCRVQQRNTNQSRETHIHVPVVLVVWKYRSKHRGRNFTRTSSDHRSLQLDTEEKGETKHLTEDSVDTVDINTKQENLEAQKEKQALDKFHLLTAVNLLMNHKFNLEKDIDELTSEVRELEKQQDKNQLVTNMQQTEQNNIQSAKINQDEETKNIFRSMKQALDKKIHENESVVYAVQVMTEKKEELDKTLETILEQLEKIKNRNEVQM
uniref:Ig-like domain-containing protein n=1 Tax=Astatotilapia calliptera TaxID=8154 RepID=A0AAX7TU42_ASTCA